MATAIQLIVNADDYGYYRCVSRGILAAASAGVVGATGILANAPNLDAQLDGLRGHENLDLGVHLNLTSRQPLTAAMAKKLPSGDFPGAFNMAGKILAGAIGLETVRAEWREQIESLLRKGLPLQFLNSHEHIHMLPNLFGLAQALADEYQIPHLRLTCAEWLPPFGVSASIRNLVLQTLASVNRPRLRTVEPSFIGLGRSGKLNLAYLRTLFATLKPDSVYELMCHPGIFDPAEITDPKLLAYHAWDGELALLTGSGFRDLCQAFSIQLVNYRQL